MSHHRQQLPGFGVGANQRLKDYEDDVPHVFEGRGFFYPHYRWTVNGNVGDVFTELWKQDFVFPEDRDPTDEEHWLISDPTNWWLWSDATEVPQPDGSFEDLTPVVAKFERKGRWRAKLRFEIPIATDDLIKVHAVWSAESIREYMYGPLHPNGFTFR